MGGWMEERMNPWTNGQTDEATIYSKLPTVHSNTSLNLIPQLPLELCEWAKGCKPAVSQPSSPLLLPRALLRAEEVMDSFGKAVFRHLISMQWLGLTFYVLVLAGTLNLLEIEQKQETQDRHRQLPEGEGEVPCYLGLHSCLPRPPSSAF